MKRTSWVLGWLLGLTACSDPPPPSPPKEEVSVHAIRNFRRTPLTAEALTTLVGQADFAGTLALDVTESPIGDAGLRAVATSPHAGTIKALWIDRTGATDAGAAALGGADLPLEELYIGYNQIGPEGLRALLEAPKARWRILRLSFDPLTDAGAVLLASHPRLETLEHLDLVSVGVGDVGARALLGSTTLAQLAELDLSHNALGLESLVPLVDPRALPALRTLDVSGHCPASDVLARIRAARPNLELKTGC